MDVWHGAMRTIRYAITARRHPDSDYELLASDPTTVRSSLPIPNSATRRRSLRACCHLFAFRPAFLVLFSIPLLLLLFVLVQGIPPSFDDIRSFERNLPQHNLSDPNHEPALYLRFPNHLWGHGLNNVLQEALLMSYIAYAAQRSFVFEDYVWSHTPFPYTLYDFALRPARMPLNAFIAGPTAGGPMEGGPAAVSARFWESVCPKERRRVVSSRDEPAHEEGSVIIDWWIDKLKGIQDPCVEVDSSSVKIFDHNFFGSSRVLSIWPGLSASPIMKQYIWSPLVFSGVLRNFPLLQPPSAKDLLDVSSTTTLSGLAAVHLRRGDYKRHCPRLAHWHASYMGFNQLPTLPDRFDPSPYQNQSSATEAYYLDHCLPTVEQIVARLHALRIENPGLKRVYVLTNGWGWWLNGLKTALRRDGWQDLKSSLDLQLDSEQKWVAMAVDMAIAERAEVFLGNGFSSLTSNIVMLRIAKGLDASTNRFL